MKWIDKILIFLLCIAASLNTVIDNAYISAILLSIISASLLDIYDFTALKAVVAAVWAILSVFYPVFLFFCPLVLYEIVFKKTWYFSLLFVLSAIITYGFTGYLNYIICFISCLCSILLRYYNSNIKQLHKDMQKMRDESKEVNILLEEKNTELLHAKDLEINLAKLTERGRISREIHDNVGHILARSIMQTGAVMAQNKDPELNESLEHLKETQALAINSMRESVHDLRDESLDLYSSVKQSLSDFGSYDINLNYDISAETPRNIKYCFISVVNEALANTAKHSNGNRIRIDMFEHPAFYKLYYHDNGTNISADETNGRNGMGLENMNRRVKELGGIFNINREKGFSLNINIPKNKEK